MIYNMLATVIGGGVYEKEDIFNKMDFYLLKDRITQIQYDELANLMDA